jgi:hypothetical protein
VRAGQVSIRQKITVTTIATVMANKVNASGQEIRPDLETE